MEKQIAEFVNSITNSELISDFLNPPTYAVVFENLADFNSQIFHWLKNVEDPTEVEFINKVINNANYHYMSDKCYVH